MRPATRCVEFSRVIVCRQLDTLCGVLVIVNKGIHIIGRYERRCNIVAVFVIETRNAEQHRITVSQHPIETTGCTKFNVLRIFGLDHRLPFGAGTVHRASLTDLLISTWRATHVGIAGIDINVWG